MSCPEVPKLPLSFVAEYAYCPRSAYYLLVDAPRSRGENEYIVEGRVIHEKVDAGYVRHRGAKDVHASVSVHSDRYGLNGRVDVVEFADDAIIPVEFKRGTSRINHFHEIQLALMGLCLREMYPDRKVDQAAVFFAADRVRREIPLTLELLDEAAGIALDVQSKTQKILQPRAFPAVLDDRCKGCCFYELCHVD
jgi:CRISPR-associated exonuclease Cas4